MNHKGYYTLITGASSGIGKALAFECAARKMNLILVALPNSGLEEIAAEIEKAYGVKTETLSVDLTDYHGPETVYKMVCDKGLVIDVLINNAGVGYNGKCETMSLACADEMVLLNTRATTLLVTLFLKDMVKLPRSYIMNIASMASFSPLPGKSIYAASKAYILFFSKALRSEVKGTGVSVCSVYPFGVKTNSVVRERIKKSGFIAKKAVMEPEEVAAISVEGMLKKKNVIIPGRMGRAVFCFGQIIPQGIVLKILEKEFKRVQND